MHFLEKLWKILENIEILNLPQHKEEETILVSEPNYHTKKFRKFLQKIYRKFTIFIENLLAIEMKKRRYL